ncbi:uncharacterized protein ACN427_011243 isoform 1-T1 [Glossina fuscipes fuscipes]
MSKNIWSFIFLVICFHLMEIMLCEAILKDKSGPAYPSDVIESVSSDLLEESRARRKRRHHLHHLWGWHALAIAYLVKVKIVIVAFFVGSAIFLGLRHVLPYKCPAEVVREASHIVYPTPPYIQPNDHVHIPYTFDHSNDFNDHHLYDDNSWPKNHASLEPYDRYSDVNSQSEPQSLRKKRHVITKRDIKTSTEERIGDFVLKFLGLDTSACRRRFLCEIEFRSKINPLTSMAFRIIGTSFFGKYINKHNKPKQANSFEECSMVNSACIFVENENLEESIRRIKNEEHVTATDVNEHSRESYKSGGIDSQNQITKLKRVRNYYSDQLPKYDHSLFNS